jgi:2-keto-4-pentenoate hydratase/2-oxohepta-3-ene-1,7-dioic acid hydratase in catechol pathway
MLYEQHWVDASRGYVRRFMPWALGFTSAWESLLGKPFPAFRPPKLGRQQPLYYFGNHLTIVPSGVPVQAPHYSQVLDYELELGWVLRKPLLNAGVDEALDAVGGYVVVNDWSAREVQRAEMASGFGPQQCKHFLTSMSLTLATAEDLGSRVSTLGARVEINGRCVTRTSTAGMSHSIGQVLSHLSQGTQLYPGELIASGTMPGGSGMESGHWLKPSFEARVSTGSNQHASCMNPARTQHRISANHSSKPCSISH